MKSLVLFLALIIGVVTQAASQTRAASVEQLLNEVTATGASEMRTPWGTHRTIQCSSKTTGGAGTFDADVEVSNDNTNWLTLATISLITSVTRIDDGLASNASWRYLRVNVTAITGAGATGSCWLGVE